MLGQHQRAQSSRVFEPVTLRIHGWPLEGTVHSASGDEDRKHDGNLALSDVIRDNMANQDGEKSRPQGGQLRSVASQPSVSALLHDPSVCGP